MGYILPVQPLQATQYAERMNTKAFNYAHVHTIAKVKKQSHFERVLDMRAELTEMQLNKEKNKNRGNSLQVHQQFIHPNPAELPKFDLKVTDRGKYYSKYVKKIL
ncbi:hypothetical protein ABE042_01480 [Viridibacillus arvi]|uniref:Uncharacterized protein n=2 Tax=Viridibacillus arvi TaxID=263475 RepID=A0A0M0LF57_9BACL|nr:hypothetical protein [Viridibacillus arvi]KOO49537.1 hypothetical protein AMD00_14395 [Viridibacillus arvi]